MSALWARWDRIKTNLFLIIYYSRNRKIQKWLNKVTIRNGLIRSINITNEDGVDLIKDIDSAMQNDIDYFDRLKSDVSIWNGISKPPMAPKDFGRRSSKWSVLLKPQIDSKLSSSFNKLPSFIGSSQNLQTIKHKEEPKISLAKIASIRYNKEVAIKSQSQNKILQNTLELKPNFENSIMIDSKLSSTFWVEDDLKQTKEDPQKQKAINLKFISRNELQQKLSKIREESRNNPNNLSILKALTNPNFKRRKYKKISYNTNGSPEKKKVMWLGHHIFKSDKSL